MDALVAAAGASTAGAAPSRPYAAVRDELDGAVAAERAGDEPRADARALEAYALTRRLRQRLGAGAASLDAAFWSADARRPGVLTALDRRAGIAGAHDRARDALSTAEQTLGDVRISRGTVVADAAIIVFREGLEAVLILAAITASFVGARRRLRRPVLLGGLAGIAATAVTWGLAQLLVSELGTGGLRLEAITGLLAIAVLLVVTNWFFHRVYWSQWIARFNRQRKRLEEVGFLSGQALGLGILGLTSVYREGFETVLFVQNLRSARAPPRACSGAAIGLAATLAVGGVTFVAPAQAPLPADADRDRRADRARAGGDDRHHRARHAGPRLAAEHADRLHRPAVGEQLARHLRDLGGDRAASSARCSFVVGSYVVARELQSPGRRAHRLAAARQ